MNDKLIELANELSSCSDILIAIGDETRQHLIIEMMKMANCSGVRVGDITKKAHLSRPAVSHHLQIMKKAGSIKVRKEGTKNYYYFDHEMKSFEKLVSSMQLAISIAKSLPKLENE